VTYVWEPLDGSVVQDAGPDADQWGFKLRRASGFEPVVISEDELFQMIVYVLMQKQKVIESFNLAKAIVDGTGPR